MHRPRHGCAGASILIQLIVRCCICHCPGYQITDTRWSLLLENGNAVVKARESRFLNVSNGGGFLKRKNRCIWCRADEFYCESWPYILYQEVVIMQNVEDDVSVRVNTSRKLDVFSFPFNGGGKRRLERHWHVYSYSWSEKRKGLLTLVPLVAPKAWSRCDLMTWLYGHEKIIIEQWGAN